MPTTTWGLPFLFWDPPINKKKTNKKISKKCITILQYNKVLETAKETVKTDLTTEISHCFVVCLARTINPVLHQSSMYYICIYSTNVYSIGIMMLRCFVCLARTLNPVLHPSNMYYLNNPGCKLTSWYLFSA